MYPYDYMDSYEKFKYTKLPPVEAFPSKLNDKHISDVDFDHAKTVWCEFDIKTMCDYHDLYLKSDLLLLVDVFQGIQKC